MYRILVYLDGVSENLSVLLASVGQKKNIIFFPNLIL